MPLYSTTTTAQDIMDAVAREVRQVLSSSVAPDSTILLDYVNRISLEILRNARYTFLESAPLLFITQRGQTDYWLGATGSAPSGVVDTGLNLTDVRTIKDGSVMDRSNFRPLGVTQEPPLSARIAYPDDTSRLGTPSQWRQSVDTPQVLNVYPAPDNQNIYQPVPSTPIVQTIAGGTLPNRVYYVSCTLLDSLGNESTAPSTAAIFVPANFLLVVKSPFQEFARSASGVQYNKWNAYAVQGANLGDLQGTLDSTSTTKQSLVPINIGTDFTEPIGGLLTTSPAPPTDNSLESYEGYLIQFRYFKRRVPVTIASQILQIPDDYFDVVVAGTTYKAFHYLFRPQEAQQWFGLYQQGLTQVIRDQNFNRGFEYIKPDSAAIGGTLPSVETIDLSILLS